MIPTLLGNVFCIFVNKFLEIKKKYFHLFIAVLCVEEVESRGLEEIGIYRVQAEEREVHALKVDLKSF